MKTSRSFRSLVRSIFAIVAAVALTASASSASCPLVSTLRVINQTGDTHSLEVVDTEGCGFDVTVSLPPGADISMPVIQGSMLPIVDASRWTPISVAAGQTVTIVIN